ncbi:hypothetical protein V8E54_010172 [Elaphomyces granulatus]
MRPLRPLRLIDTVWLVERPLLSAACLKDPYDMSLDKTLRLTQIRAKFRTRIASSFARKLPPSEVAKFALYVCFLRKRRFANCEYDHDRLRDLNEPVKKIKAIAYGALALEPLRLSTIV